jgi:hypothetical protein
MRQLCELLRVILVFLRACACMRCQCATTLDSSTLTSFCGRSAAVQRASAGATTCCVCVCGVRVCTTHTHTTPFSLSFSLSLSQSISLTHGCNTSAHSRELLLGVLLLTHQSRDELLLASTLYKHRVSIAPEFSQKSLKRALIQP